MLYCTLVYFVYLVYTINSIPQPQVSSDSTTQCTSYADYGYFCVPYYQCNGDNVIVTDGQDLFDPRQAGVECPAGQPPSHLEAVTSKCGALLQVCCKHPEQSVQPECNNYDYEGEEDIFGKDENDIFGPDIDDDLFGKDDEDDVFGTGPESGSPGQCGKRNTAGLGQSNLEPAVDDAQFGEWPHVCAVLRREFIGEEVKIYQCGASLISDTVVLTAAHCLNISGTDPTVLVVRCGEWDTQSEEERLPYQEIDVESIQIHPEFNIANHHQNYALLFLVSQFQLTSHISPVCLPSPGVELSQQNCVSHGWGKDKFGAEGRYSTILKEVVVPLVSNAKCQQLLRDNTRLGQFFELDDSFLCAGGQKDIDTCKGDGGSPLTCRQDGGPWFQAGIVSWGIGCGENNVPAVYSNVGLAVCWVDRKVSCHNGMSKSYFGFSELECGKFECTEEDIFAR